VIVPRKTISRPSRAISRLLSARARNEGINVDGGARMCVERLVLCSITDERGASRGILPRIEVKLCRRAREEIANVDLVRG